VQDEGKLVALPKPMSEAQLAIFQYELSNIIEAANAIDTPVTLSKEVEYYWGEGGGCYERLTKDYPGVVGCVINRAEAQVLRLAMIYALLDRQHTIELDHVYAALAVWDYCRKSAIRIFNGRERNNVSQRVIDALEGGSKTGTELYAMFHNHVTKNNLMTALSDLEAADKIRVKVTPTNGRPKTTYLLKDPNEES
jgi:hypothetical protein